MTNINLNDLEIPKPSAQAAKALAIVTSAEPDMQALEQAVMHDPLLASSLLRYANSPLYRRASEITNIPTALKLLGLNSVRSAVVTASIRSVLPVDSRVGQYLLAHMTDIAMLCKLISIRCCAGAGNDLEFLGLVHDVGMLTLAANFERAYDNILTQAIQQGVGIDVLERNEFGISHDRVTALTAETFRLPKRHVDIVASFHSQQSLQAIESEQDRDVCVLALAHCLRDELAEGENSTMASPSFKETLPGQAQPLAALLNIDSLQLDALRDKAAELIQVEQQLA